MSISEASSDLYIQNKYDLSVSERSNCVSMEKQLHSALEELESAKLIIKLLQKESDEDFPHDDGTSEVINIPSDTSATVYSNRLENNEWTVYHRKSFSSNNPTEVNNTYLQDMLANDTTLKTQEENNTSGIPSCDHQIKLQHQSRERIQQIDKKNREDFQIYHIQPYLTAK